MKTLASLLVIESKSEGKIKIREMENSPIVYNENLSDSPGLEITGKILVSVIVILFFTIALFLFLHLYLKKWFQHRPRQHDQETLTARRRAHFVASGDPSAANRCQLDPSVLNSLPVITFSTKDEEMECTVCLSETLEGEKVRILPKCNHGFHVDCIDMWFQSNSTCPICRNLVSNDILKTEAVFPTNVLVWGNQGEVINLTPNSEEPSSSSSSSSPSNVRPNEMLVIEMPRQIDEDEEIQSPIIRQFKSFKRLLSMGTTRVSPSSSSTDSGKKGPEQC